MDEDIVTRLRNDVCDTRPCVGCELSSAAADEIERLRAELLGMTADRDGWKNLSKWGWKKIAELESTNG